MKFRFVRGRRFSRHAALGLVAAGALVAAVVACGNSSSDSEAPSRVLPTAPDVGPTTSSERHTFAIQDLFLGNKNRAGVEDPSAWRTYGYNIDGKVSTRSSADVCSPVAGASNAVQVDGENGLDNAFGLSILPILLSSPNTVQKMNEQIHHGDFTLLIDTVGLNSDPKQSNTALGGQIFSGAAFGKDVTPTFTMADNWPVTREMLADGKSLDGGSRVKFTNAFVKDGTFAGVADSLTLTFGLDRGARLDLVLYKATLSFAHSGSGLADNGQIAGVLKTNELIESVRKIAGVIDPSYCTKERFELLTSLLRSASDIMGDGSNAPGQPCDAISVGLGFTAKEIQAPSKVAGPAPPPVDSCAPQPIADAGTD